MKTLFPESSGLYPISLGEIAALHNGLYSIPDYKSGIAALPVLILTTDRECPLYPRGTHLREQEVIQIQEFPGEDPWTP